MHDEAPTMFFFFFSLFNLEKHVALAKKQNSMLFINFIIFEPHSFNCIKFDLFYFSISSFDI
jgi:hypothetical protein